MSAYGNDDIFLSPESIIADLLTMTSIREDSALADRDDDVISAVIFNAGEAETPARETPNALDSAME